MIWRSTFKKSLGETVNNVLSPIERDVFYMLFNGFGCKQKLQSSFFELFRVGDGKYTLIVQKFVDGSITIRFTTKNNYANKNERFTK